MCNEMVKVFETAEFGQVRTMLIDGDPWFVGKDVAECLGYGNGKSLTNAVANHVDEDDKGVTKMMTPGGIQKMIIINESGLYSLIMSSKLPSAKSFKRWVTSEVLPAIRKTGSYNMPNFNNPIEAARAWADAQEAKQLAEAKVTEMAPKAAYCDDVIGAEGTEPITRIAKDYGKTAQQMNEILSQLHIQYAHKDKNGRIKYWLLYKEHHDKGYTKNVSYVIERGRVSTSMCWTEKGRKFIYDTLKKMGIMPINAK